MPARHAHINASWPCPRCRRTLARFVGKVQLALEALQPAMMQLAAAAAEAADAAAGEGGAAGQPDMQTLGSEGLADAWSAALRDSPADSPASAHRRRRSGGSAADDAPEPLAGAASPYEPQPPREALMAAWAEAAADVREALAAAADLVAACGAMGRLQVRRRRRRRRCSGAVGAAGVVPGALPHSATHALHRSAPWPAGGAGG